MSAGSRKILLAAALAILIGAVIWRIFIELNSPLRSICARINEYGYNVSPDELTLEGYGLDMDLESLVSESESLAGSMEEIVACSRSCGFDADMKLVGKIELLTYSIDSDNVMLIYAVDGKPQLVFIEKLSTGEVLPIG